MDMHTELKAVPHASLGYQFLRVQVKPKGGWGVVKRNGGQSLKSTTRRQGNDGRTCLPSEVLGLASRHSEIGKLQVRESDQLSYPVRQVASLDMVPERTPCPPAEELKNSKL